MEVDISKHIVDLLHEHDVVSLPGLGSFVGSYKSAVVDQVSGSVSPPAKAITFDDNLRMDDGLLVDTVGKTYGITFDTATDLVQNYVNQIRQLLDGRETVSFPNLGRLYMDFERNLQFLPDVTNFNIESHGLPEIKAYPIAQPEPEPVIPPEPIIAENRHSGTSLPSAISLGRAVNNWLKDNVLLVGILATVALAVLIFNVIRGPLDQSTSNTETPVNIPPPMADEEYRNDFPTQEVPDDQRQPLTSDKQGAIVDDDDAVVKEEVERPKPQPKSEVTAPPKITEKPVTPTPTPAPAGDKTGIIAIGSFKDQGNIDKLVAKISAAGLTPYKAANGNLTRVGVQFTYSTPTELNNMLSTVRKKFEPGAIIIKR
jgi:cell division septation protein DedD/nucleoid DNA-binding protein